MTHRAPEEIWNDPSLLPPRTLGPIEAVGIIYNKMVGTGIFASLGIVLGFVYISVGLSLIVWVSAGIIVILGSLCLAELGAALPGSGGFYVYLSRGLHPVFGFLFVWACFFCLRTSGLSIVALIFARYFGSVIFTLDRSDPQIDQDLRVKLLAMFCLIGLGVLNFFSARASTFLTNGLAIFKFVAIGLIILFALIGITSTETFSVAKNNFMDPLETINTVQWTEILGAMGVATLAALWTFDPFTNITSIAEQIEKPHRNLPLVVLVAVTAVALTYFSVVVSFYCVLPASEVIGSQAVALEMAEVIAGPPGQFITPLFVAFSALGSLNAIVLSGSRGILTAAKDGVFPFPRVVGRVSRFETPYVSLLLMICTSVIMLVPGNLKSLISYYAFTAWLFYLAVVVSVVMLRWREPGLERPYRVPLLCLVAPLVVCIAVVMLGCSLAVQPGPSLFGVVFLIMGFPLYYLFLGRREDV